MHSKLLIITLLIGLSISACSTKNSPKQAHVIVFKTPKFRYADAGFVQKNSTAFSAQIFMMGHVALKLEFDKKVCINSSCMTKKAFNARVLNAYYYKDLIFDLFSGREIFNARNRIDEANGFSQHISGDNYEIYYKVSNDTIRFKDTKNSILIKLRRLHKE